MLSTPAAIISSKCARTLFGIGAVEQRRVGRNAEASGNCGPHAFHSDVVTALTAHGEVVVLTLAVDVDRKREILARRKEVQLLLQQKRVRAHVNVFLARDEPGNDLRHLRVQQRLAAGDRNHRGAALFDCLEALFRREFGLEDVRGILNLSAARTGEVAAEQRLEHQHERIPFAPAELLLQNISCNRPGLRDWDCHPVSPPSKFVMLRLTLPGLAWPAHKS